MRIEDAGLEPSRVYGRPADGWKFGDPNRESMSPIGVEPDEYILRPGDIVERFEETTSRAGRELTIRVCRVIA